MATYAVGFEIHIFSSSTQNKSINDEKKIKLKCKMLHAHMYVVYIAIEFENHRLNFVCI